MIADSGRWSMVAAGMSGSLGTGIYSRKSVAEAGYGAGCSLLAGHDGLVACALSFSDTSEVQIYALFSR